jgi:fermentation-respiration switch protein FrsA (DUF1100 family)
MMVESRDIDFEVEGGDHLRGWLFQPEVDAGPHPAISMAHGYAGVKELGLERFARAFAEAGFAVLLHDHRNFGSSDGALRHDIDPWRQIADWRRAISFLESLPEVDPNRIGVWGTSYAGGHVLVLGATDRRIRAVDDLALDEPHAVCIVRLAVPAVLKAHRWFDILRPTFTDRPRVRLDHISVYVQVSHGAQDAAIRPRAGITTVRSHSRQQSSSSFFEIGQGLLP